MQLIVRVLFFMKLIEKKYFHIFKLRYLEKFMKDFESKASFEISKSWRFIWDSIYCLSREKSFLNQPWFNIRNIFSFVDSPPDSERNPGQEAEGQLLLLPPLPHLQQAAQQEEGHHCRLWGTRRWEQSVKILYLIEKDELLSEFT